MTYRNMPGYVYFLADQKNDLVKIGFSSNVSARIKAIRANAPVKLDFVGAIDGTPELERKFHERFSEHREHNEWFRYESGCAYEIDEILTTESVMPEDMF